MADIRNEIGSWGLGSSIAPEKITSIIQHMNQIEDVPTRHDLLVHLYRSQGTSMTSEQIRKVRPYMIAEEMCTYYIPAGRLVNTDDTLQTRRSRTHCPILMTVWKRSLILLLPIRYGA